MAVLRRAAWRALSVAQQMTIGKIRRAFDGVISPHNFLLEGEINVDEVLQMWDCFAEVYLEIASLKEESLDLESKRQLIADLMVWFNIDTHDKKTQRFLLAPHLSDTAFISVGRHLRHAMVARGMLDPADPGPLGCEAWDSESQASTTEDWTQE
eukprot:evm.model.scf_89.22 EVM.evm.TU.scf_89.22   scf_89:123570-126351(+)